MLSNTFQHAMTLYHAKIDGITTSPITMITLIAFANSRLKSLRTMRITLPTDDAPFRILRFMRVGGAGTNTTTSQTSHAVSSCTFSAGVSANTTASTTGTESPKASAPRMRRGYHRSKRSMRARSSSRYSSLSDNALNSCDTR